MSKHFIQIFGIFLASGIIAAGGELDINLVRNANFRPGMDGQAPADWQYWGAQRTNIYEAGRGGHMTFTEDGVTIAGQAQLFQSDMWDDVTPAYKLACRMKSEGAKGASVSMRVRNKKTVGFSDFSLANRELNVWEDLELEVKPKDHYGFFVTIKVPAGAKLSISSLRVTAALKPNTAGQVLISDNGGYIPARGIRLSVNPNWAEQLAAHELRVNAYLVAGAALPVFAGGGEANEKGFIRVASLKKMIAATPPAREPESWWRKLLGRRPAPAAPEANGFRLVCGGGNVELTGGNDAGVLAGEAHLAELLGAKYYAPQVYAVATNLQVKIARMDISRQPAFEWADFSVSQNQTWTPWKYGYLHTESCVAPSGKASPLLADWVHPPLFLAPPYLYAKEHPDFYALVGGKRMGNSAISEWGYLNLCLSNPELHKVVAERIARLMDLYPQCKYFGIGQGDGVNWCECDKCRALDVDKKSWTDRLVTYANAVAALLNEKHPDRKLLILAYGQKTEDLPLKAKLHPNVRVMYALWGGLKMKVLDDWNAFTGTNLLLFTYPVNTYENADTIKLAAAKGVKGFFPDCSILSDFPEVVLYTGGRLIWDPGADVEQMIDEIMPHIYGASAPFMRRYFDMHHAFLMGRGVDPARRRLCDEPNRARFRRLPLEYAEKALDLLTQAEKAAGTDEYALKKIHTDKYRVLYAYFNEILAIHPDVSDEQFEGYVLKMVELVKLAQKSREPFAGYHVPFSEWLYQTSTGALDFDRSPVWFADPKVAAFLAADPVKTLKSRWYFQEKLKYRILYEYINEFCAGHPDIPEDQFEGYALKMAELVKLARKCREPFAGDNVPFSKWLYQTSTGVLDYDRGPYTWFNDPKIEAFLADPVKTLKTRVYFQEKITNGWALPPKALLGGEHLEQYQGQQAPVVIRRHSSPVARVRAYWRLDALPEKEAELQVLGLDNEHPEKAEISIKINNHEIFAGPVDFTKNKWEWRKYKVPREYLEPGENVIVIENTTKDYKTEKNAIDAGPVAEAQAKQYYWGWCMLGALKITGVDAAK